MSGRPQMDDYVDVAERLVEFRTKHPEGSCQQVDLKFIDFAGMSWVVYTAAAYRTPDDLRPGQGTAWEPVPGRTPFTRDSELQNAETAAWGRAIVAALAADTKRGGVASRQEVRNRDADRQEPLLLNTTSPLARAMYAAITEDPQITEEERVSWIGNVINRDITSTKEMTEDEARKVLTVLAERKRAGATS